MVYHTRESETQALEHFDLSVYEGEFLGIVGPSGAGKTTLLSLLDGILTPTSGEITLEGKKVNASGMGYMLQRDQLFDWRTIYKNVLLGLELKGKADKQAKAYALALLEKYGLKDYAHRYPRELSGGMRQRAALIRTLALRPRVVLLDEPFSALDYQTRLTVGEDVRGIIKSEGLTAVLVTHDIGEAVALCDRVAVLTARPAMVKSIHDTLLSGGTSLEKREDENFPAVFAAIWKELTNEKDNLSICFYNFNFSFAYCCSR